MTRIRDDIALIRDLATSGIDLMTLMPVAAPCLHRLVPSFSLSMIRVDERCAPQEHYSEHFGEASHRLFAEAGHAFAARSDDPAAFGNLLRGKKPFGALVHGPAELHRGATYEHLFAPNGIHHVLDLALRDGAGPLGILGIFRERDGLPFSRGDVAMVAGLYPHLVHACAARPRSIESHADHDEVDTALLLVTTEGRIELASPNARRWLEDATGGPDRAAIADRDLLPAACRHLARWWERARLDTSEETTAKGPPTVCLPLPGGQLRLRAYGLAGALGTPSPGGLVGIQLTLEMHRELRVRAALAQISLTPQQRRVALALWAGKDAAAIRAELGIGLGTLKTYQKELYARLGVSKVTELRTLLDTQARAITFDLARHQPSAK